MYVLFFMIFQLSCILRTDKRIHYSYQSFSQHHVTWRVETSMEHTDGRERAHTHTENTPLQRLVLQKVRRSVGDSTTFSAHLVRSHLSAASHCTELAAFGDTCLPRTPLSCRRHHTEAPPHRNRLPAPLPPSGT